MKRITFILALLCSVPATILAQNTGSLLLVSDVECTVSVDGEDAISMKTNQPRKFDLVEGQHYLVCKSTVGEKSEIVEITAGQQKVHKLLLSSVGSPKNSPAIKTVNRQDIADLEVDLAGGIEIAAAVSDGAEEADYYPAYFYSLQKGDILSVDIQFQNNKGTINFELVSYPDGNEIFSQQKFQDLEQKEIKIPHDGIYRLTISNNHMFGKRIKLHLSRIPVNEESAKKPTKVQECMKYTVVKLQEPMSQWINSTSNETWKGGTNEVTIPVKLPPNTVEWYYVVSASRNKEDIQRNLDNAGLFKELTNFVGGINPTTMVLNIGMDLITQPPGSDYCDVYLLDYANNSLFSSDQAFSYILEGSRENVNSAKVKIKGVNSGQCYLGLQNRDAMHGLAVGIEVVAITGEKYFGAAE